MNHLYEVENWPLAFENNKIAFKNEEEYQIFIKEEIALFQARLNKWWLTTKNIH